MKPNFLCFGSATQDVYLSNSKDFTPVNDGKSEDFEFELGSKVNVNKIDFRTGGGASNAATTFSRNGFRTFFLGTIGKSDPAASAILADFDREGVDTRFISYSEKYNSDYSTLLLAPGGERTILTYRGCGIHLKKSDFDISRILDEVKIDWIYITSLAGHFAIYDEIFREASERGVKIAWNPGVLELSHPDKVKALLPDVEVLSINKEEAQMLVGGETIEELSRKLRNFVPVVIVTDGRNGSVAIDKTSFVQAGLYDPVSKRVDATGAGDSFASGFVAKYAADENLKKAIHFASANSANVVQYIGSKPGILTGSEKLESMDIAVRPANY